jgi:hypothetical protein
VAKGEARPVLQALLPLVQHANTLLGQPGSKTPKITALLSDSGPEKANYTPLASHKRLRHYL